MKKTIYKYLNFWLLINSFLWGVGEAGAIFLLISPSPAINGVGGSGVSTSTMDIYSSHYNPAQTKLPDGLSVQFSNYKTSWLPNLNSDLTLQYNVQMFGYNGFSLLDKYLVQLSITSLNTHLDLGESNILFETISGWNSYMSSKAMTYSLGISSDKYPIYLGFGKTFKKVEQILKNGSDIETSNNEFQDWGIKFVIDNYKLKNIQNLGINYSFGYSKSNIGDPVRFGNQVDLPPTNSRLGMTLGMEYIFYKNLGINFTLVREAEELMVENIVNESVSAGYESIYKDGYVENISIKNHIIDGIAEEDVIIHNGYEITLFDCIYIRDGKYVDIEGYIEVDTDGFGIDLGGVLKVGSYLIDSPSLRDMKLLKYINLHYNLSNYNAETGHPLDNISFDELTVTIKNIEKLFY